MLSIQDEKKDLLASVGPPIYLLRVKDSLPSTLSLSDEDLVQYMKVLTEEQVINKICNNYYEVCYYIVYNEKW